MKKGGVVGLRWGKLCGEVACFGVSGSVGHEGVCGGWWELWGVLGWNGGWPGIMVVRRVGWESLGGF